MQLHKKVRQEVFNVLNRNITGIEHYYPSRPLFVDIDQESSVLAVFLDDVQCTPVGLCAREWDSILNIAIYLKTTEGENELDDLTELVSNFIDEAIQDDQFKYINTIALQELVYEQDTQNRTWFVANLRYQITYQD